MSGHNPGPDGVCCGDAPARGSFFRRYRTWIFTGVPALFALAAFAFPLLEPFRAEFRHYLQIVAVPLLLGLLLGGAIERYIPGAYVSKLLAESASEKNNPGGSRGSIFAAVFLGWGFSCCSHGILAIAMELYRKGASTAATIAFLLASPWANLPITFMLFGFFGWKAVFFILSAIIVAAITGFTYQFLERHGLVEVNPNTMNVDESFSISSDVGRRWERFRLNRDRVRNDTRDILREAAGLADMVVGWTVLGITMAALVSAYVPGDWLQRYLNPSLGGLLVTLLIASAIEICSEGSAPLAFQVYQVSGGFGNAMAFLMAGVATDYTEIGLIWQNIGHRAALWMPVICVPQIILLSYIFNRIFA